MGPTADLDASENRKISSPCRESNYDSTVVQIRLSYRGIQLRQLGAMNWLVT